MTTYNAPVDEMMFLFDHLKDDKKYNEIEKFKDINYVYQDHNISILIIKN